MDVVKEDRKLLVVREKDESDDLLKSLKSLNFIVLLRCECDSLSVAPPPLPHPLASTNNYFFFFFCGFLPAVFASFAFTLSPCFP